MHLRSIVVALGLASGAVALSGKSYTGWDCCKPGCAWKSNLGKDVQGSPKVCDINNNPLSGGLDAKSGCDKDGKAYLCADYTPIPQAANLTYGFAVMFGAEHCCKCYSVTWTNGAASGKSMIVQAITTAEVSGSVGKNDIVIQTPGGGSGENEQGCRNQYGTNWGNKGGGVDNSQACSSLPQNLQGGCYWRFNWAGGPMNGWGINYQQTACPRELTRVSGCSA